MSAALLFVAASSPRIERRESFRLGMQHLSPLGLSEPWWLRDCGDRHWALIAEALGQQGTAFQDPEGHAVYAAFCATDLRLAPAARSLLGASVEVCSTLHALGANGIGSEHRFLGKDGPLGSLRMISCFLRHDGSGSNRRLLRGALAGMAPLPPATEGLARLHAGAREAARAARLARRSGPEILGYTPLGMLDFNAAGLLYFPTFSKIAEMARPCVAPLRRRQVVYLGNLDPGEAVSVECHAAQLRLWSGDRILAQVTTDGGGPGPSDVA